MGVLTSYTVRRRAWLALALFVGPTACSSADSQKLRTVVPMQMPGPAESLDAKGWIAVDQEHGRIARTRSWKLNGEPVQEAGLIPSDDPLIARAAAQSGQEPALPVQSSKQLRCYARERAAFWNEHQAGPTEAIERYMAAACGVWGYRPYVFHKRILVGEQDQIRASVRDVLSVFPAAGIFAAAQRLDPEQNIWLTVAYDATPFRWAPVPVSVPGRKEIELVARPLIDAGFEDGVVTQGPFGWHECAGSGRAAAQTTSVRCRYNATDVTSFVDVSNVVGQDKNAGPPFRVGLFGSDGVVNRFTEGEGYASRVQGPMSDPAKLLMVLNETRRRAGMPRINSDAQLGLRIDEWWRRPNAQEVKAAFFQRSGAYHASGTDQGASGAQLLISSFILPKGLSSAEAIERALLLPQVRAVLLSSRIRRVAIRQYEIDGRDAIETMVAAYLR